MNQIKIPDDIQRHPLINKSDTSIQPIIDEFELDKALGLFNQARLTSQKALAHDIDELTSNKNFFEVTPKTLEKLFNFNSLKKHCFFSNLTSSILGFFKGAILPLSLDIIALSLIYPLFRFSFYAIPWHYTPTSITIGIFNIITWIGWIILVIAGIRTWSDITIPHTILDIKLDLIKLDQVTEKIPYGAKLKIKEAQNTNLFQSFVFATPSFTTRKLNDIYNKSNKKLPKNDPAILGVTLDQRMYMIVYWDIQKDTEKIIKNINKLKPFKLK